MSNRPTAFVFGRNPYEEQTIKFKDQEIPLIKIRHIIYNAVDRYKIPQHKKNELYSDCLSEIPEIAYSFRMSELSENKKDNVLGYIKRSVHNKAKQFKVSNNVVQSGPLDKTGEKKNELVFLDSFEHENSNVIAEDCQYLRDAERKEYLSKTYPYAIKFIQEELTDRDRAVIENYFGINGNLKISARELAKKLDTSRANIFLIIENSLFRMRKYIKCIEENGLTPKEYFLEKYKNNKLEDDVEFMLFFRQATKLLKMNTADMVNSFCINVKTIGDWRRNRNMPNLNKRVRVKAKIMKELRRTK